MDGEIPPLSPILPLKTTVHVILMAHISIHLSLAKLDRILAVISYMSMEKFLKEVIRLVPTTPCTQITYLHSIPTCKRQKRYMYEKARKHKV